MQNLIFLLTSGVQSRNTQVLFEVKMPAPIKTSRTERHNSNCLGLYKNIATSSYFLSEKSICNDVMATYNILSLRRTVKL